MTQSEPAPPAAKRLATATMLSLRWHPAVRRADRIAHGGAARINFGSTMSDMTAVLRAVMAFAMAAAARLADGTDTNSPEAKPRRSTVRSDRHPARCSVP